MKGVGAKDLKEQAGYRGEGEGLKALMAGCELSVVVNSRKQSRSTSPSPLFQSPLSLTLLLNMVGMRTLCYHARNNKWTNNRL